MNPWSRRHVVGGLCGCGLGLLSNPSLARISSEELSPQVTPGYQPTDLDERGLWQACDRLEQEVSNSNLLVKDPGLTAYLTSVVTRLLGKDLAADLRIYPMRNASFNAAMAPNGMMLINSGLLLRMLDEAQLAAVIGHECGHYLRRHTLQNWRSVKTKAAIANFALVGAAPAGGNLYQLAAIYDGLLLALFSFGRTLEREADAYGLKLLGAAEYDPQAAADVWAHVIGERKASAAARNKKYRDRATSLASTHPPSEERMSELAASATLMSQQRSADAHYENRRTEWLTAIAGLRQPLLAEQVKLNDPGASLYLLNNLASNGWDGMLRYFEGEVYRLRDETGDSKLAANAYATAIELPNVPAEGFRAHGYAQLKAGNVEDGRRALTRYLELQPTAPDAAMVRFSIQQ